MKIHHKILLGAIAVAGVVAGMNIVLPNSSVRVLPDSVLTPGFVNTDISQANIDQTICNSSWSTKSIRPPVSYTNTLKKMQIKAYGYSDTSMADYEEDHLISLELGGSPTDSRNLWPESYKTTPNAKNKDSVENWLHKQVCNGSLTLQEAQHDVSTDWTKVYASMPGNGALGSISGPINSVDNDDQ